MQAYVYRQTARATRVDTVRSRSTAAHAWFPTYGCTTVLRTLQPAAVTWLPLPRLCHLVTSCTYTSLHTVTTHGSHVR